MINSILLIDDRTDFVQQFVELAKSKQILVSHKKSFAGLKEILPAYSHKFAAVVLDIKCLLKDDQEIENANFITVALGHLNQYLPNFPRYILTGDDKEFETIAKYYEQEKVFLKTPQDLGKLLVELKYCVDNSEILKIKRDNLSVFEIFKNGQMSAASEVQLIRILQDGLKETDFGKFKGILADIRSMQEAMYKSINLRNTAVVPNLFFETNGMIKFNPLMKHLNGNLNGSFVPTSTVYQNSTVSQLANGIYRSCGEYIHETPNRKYLISDYVLKALINSLLELLLWSKQY